MLFCSPQFLLFFLAVFAAYCLLPWGRARVLLLLAASFFYACWNRWLAALLAGSCAFDYFLAPGMAASRSPRLRRRLDRLPGPVQGLGFGAALSLALVLAPHASKAFICFQF
jgi:hypothetical protein